jgi:hypothetical protein
MPQLGDFGVVRGSGFVDWAIRWCTQSSVNHAFLCVGNGQIVEAESNGAILSPVDKYGDRAIWSSLDLDDAKRQRIGDAGRKLDGTPYGYLDILAIGIYQRRFGRVLRPLARWAAKRIESTHTLICSQLVDQAYLMAGVHLFDDGRLPGLVSPGDLLDLIQAHDTTGV